MFLNIGASFSLSLVRPKKRRRYTIAIPNKISRSTHFEKLFTWKKSFKIVSPIILGAPGMLLSKVRPGKSFL
jgi:hypothetical protein